MADNWPIIEGLAQQVRWHLVRPITELSCRPVTIKAQVDPLASRLAADARRVVQPGVSVSAREDPFQRRVEITLRASRWWRWRHGATGRKSAVVRATIAVAGSAPANVAVSVRWLS
jgi:hypothetical protein